MGNEYWGIDIGGTKTAFIIGDAQGRVLSRQEVPTKQYSGWQDLMEALVPKQGHPLAVGVSCGSPLDSKLGMVLSPPNLPGWDEVPITDWLSQRLGVPAYLENDANACALAEWRYGAGQGTHSMIYLTFGTGFGAGLILDGRLYRGQHGMSGEIGHVRYSRSGPVGYGKAGSYEGFCSGGGIAQMAGMTARETVERADAGDKATIAVLRRSARALGSACALLIDLFNPQRIVIGSVFARAERWFRPDMERIISCEALPGSVAGCDVVAAQLGDAVGDLAALSVGIDGLEGERRHA